MILIINTTEDKTVSEKIRSELAGKDAAFDIVEASEMKIGNCIGCNYCWLKTPGICTVKDDHEIILRKMVGPMVHRKSYSLVIPIKSHHSISIFEKTIKNSINQFPN